jgi:hypothetical protein
MPETMPNPVPRSNVGSLKHKTKNRFTMLKTILSGLWMRLALIISVVIVIVPWVWYFKSSIGNAHEEQEIALFTDVDGFDVMVKVPRYVTPSHDYALRFLVRNTSSDTVNVSLSLDHNDLAVNFNDADKLPFVFASNELRPNEALNEQATMNIAWIINSRNNIEVTIGLSSDRANYIEQISIPVEILPLYISIGISLSASLSGLALWIWNHFIKPKQSQTA